MNEKCRAGIEHHQLVCTLHALTSHLSLLHTIFLYVHNYVCSTFFLRNNIEELI